MDAAHTAFVKCIKAIQPLPEAEQVKVVRAMAILLGILPWQEQQPVPVAPPYRGDKIA